MILRPYQEAAKRAAYEHLRARDDNPCVVMPTGSGKSPLMASICHDAVALWNGRVLVLAHVKELLEQTAEKLTRTCPQVRFGIYSAGLKRRDTDAPVIVAGIQSAYQRACELGAFDLALVDEAHLIPPEGDGMYRQLLREAKVVNPRLRVVGFTATPFRLDSGPICTAGGYLNAVCYEVGVRELIRDGYLCPLVSRAGKASVDTSKLHVRSGEFVAGEAEDMMDEQALVEAACGEVAEHTASRRKVLIFATGVRHGGHVVDVLKARHGIDCGFVTGETAARERRGILEQFRAGDLKYVCNVNVLTTGFDAPDVDCVVLLRPTLSTGLYYQMVGRGFRVHPGKDDCLVLDFGGNVLRHGPVDQLNVNEDSRGKSSSAPAKECPGCRALVAAVFALCPHCGHLFPPRGRQQHGARASDAGVLAAEVLTTWYAVEDVFYSVHHKRGAPDDAPRSMRVDYKVGRDECRSEWVCFEHEGYPRQRAIAWWRQHSPDPVPDTAARAVEVANGGGVALARAIRVRGIVGEKYETILDRELGDMPEAIPAGDPSTNAPDDIPF
jgi:DNA repair protein RadD